LPQIGAVAGPGDTRLRIAVVTRSLRHDSSPEMVAHTLKTAALIEELGHRVDYLDRHPIPDRFVDDFLVYWASLAMGTVRGGRVLYGNTFDRERLDNLTLGLDRYARRNLHRLPSAIARLRRIRRVTARFYEDHDVLLTPTVARDTPLIGHLDPTASYEQIMERLIDGPAAFTPLQNATGEPSMSLPLAQSANGMPVGMLFSAPLGHEKILLELAYELEAARPFARIQDY
jgi:amidase